MTDAQLHDSLASIATALEALTARIESLERSRVVHSRQIEQVISTLRSVVDALPAPNRKPEPSTN